MAAELDEIDVDAFLADSVVVAENKVYAQGAGWDTIFSAAFPTRHPRLGVGVILRVPWTATNQVHELSVKLVDPDGNPLQLAPAPPGTDIPDGVVKEVRGQFTAGRPPLLSPGDSQIVPVAINLDGLLFNEPNMYGVVIAVDGVDRKRLQLRVRLAQQLAGIGVTPAPGR